jgi:AcrR family transcriptional regulator
MPRAALTPVEIAATRDQICAVATGLFAKHGYGGVTMRGIAAELGCSAMTPYRYFDGKEAIFDAVRIAAFGRFGDALEVGANGVRDPEARLEALAFAYLGFALSESAAYRIMFELDQASAPIDSNIYPEEGRAWQVLCRTVEDAIAGGVIAGDRDTVAHLFWGGLHGLASLHLAGKLQLGRKIEPLTRSMLRALLDGTRP